MRITPHDASLVSRGADWLLRLLGLWFLAMLFLGVFNVASRYLFGLSLLWADELAVLSMIALTWLGAIVGAWRAAEIRMDILLEAVPVPVRRWLRAMHQLVTILLLGWLSALSMTYAARAWSFDLRSDALRLPMWVTHAAIPLCFACVALIALYRLWCIVSVADEAGGS